ncbi:amidohydrolase family protein [Amycolatopsis rhizosphaerae]|uniref:Amidohydrolase family protein n=1 Tax=Amycolatopsis rhizosphaerae TaxID=2053003 RepID=A0A558CIK6_9PSEU|nr:amidohydrolase family protein [Amycolatopsis rhizosphaerae]TVT48600.1 amidohydrolase family protein [Amycolatopsis rhizosphaerae]
MIIDAHSHVHDPVELQIAALDEAGVDKAVLFGTRPHPERAVDLASLRREMDALTRTLEGDEAAPREAAVREWERAARAYPDRFLPFAKVSLTEPDVEGLRGIGELTPPPDRAETVEPVLRAAADRGGLPVVVHGAAPTTRKDLHTLAALARRYPRVPLVVSQLGGAHWMDAIELARDVPSLYLELSTANIVFAVRIAIAELPERTLFGSDAPYGDPVLARAMVERVTSPGEVRDLVLGGTIVRLVNL